MEPLGAELHGLRGDERLPREVEGGLRGGQQRRHAAVSAPTISAPSKQGRAAMRQWPNAVCNRSGNRRNSCMHWLSLGGSCMRLSENPEPQQYIQ